MILETVTCFVLHCHRCNAAMEGERETPIHWTVDTLGEEFAASSVENDYGWIRLGDRYLCRNCFEYADDTGWPEEKHPLPADKAEQIARMQASYRTDGQPADGGDDRG
jgi:hypothetical protein